jgi:ABC-2 type transport system permease protein
MLFYYGFSQTIILFYWMIYSGIYQLPKFLNDGNWDRYNFYPVNPLYILIVENIDISRIIHLVFSIGILIYSIIMLSITGHLVNMFFLLFEIIVGTSILGDCTIILGSFSFYIKRSRQSPSIIIYMIQMLALYPFFLYNKHILFLLKFVIPFYYITYFPSLFLLNKNKNLNNLLIQLMLFVLLKVFSNLLFNFSKRHYISAN